MPVSKEEKEFVTYAVELMQSIGPASSKRMFGGHGIFLDGLMFALIADNVLYLKIDEQSEHNFSDLGLQAFSFSKNGKTFQMSYYQAPEEALENDEDMHYWAQLAYDAALRAAAKKPKKKSKKRKSKKT